MTQEEICRELAEASGHCTGIGQFDYFNDWNGTGALIEWFVEANLFGFLLTQKSLDGSFIATTGYYRTLADRAKHVPCEEYEVMHANAQKAIVRAIYAAVKAQEGKRQ